MADGRNVGLIITLAGIALIFAVTLIAYAPVTPRQADAPPQVFSAGRARSLLSELVGSDVPHPIGSTANAQLRTAIVERLTALGYTTQLQSGFACSGDGECGFPVNIIATPSADFAPTATSGPPLADAVLLAAHYDSVPAGPGASDDGAGVAAVLEIARALPALPATRHPIMLLISDGEEAGILGATLFVREHPLSKRVFAAVNLDARGTSGPSLMFETGSANDWLMGLYGSAVERPVTDSIYYVAYRRLPNDTDFTAFKTAHYQGFNLAFLGDVARYHTPLDNWANTSPATLQHQGDNALSSVLALANAESGPHADGESVFFDVFARALIAWPTAVNCVLAAATLIAWFTLAAVLIRRGAVTGRQAAWGGLGTVVTLMLGPALCTALLMLLHAAGATPPLSIAWIAHPAAMNVVCAALAVLAAGVCAGRLVRRAAFWGFWIGMTGVAAVLSVALALTFPGASFLPLLLAASAVIAALPGLGAPAAAGAALIPAWVVFAGALPVLLILYPALGVVSWPLSTLLLCLCSTALLPLLAGATPFARQAVVVVAGSIVLAGILLTMARPVYSAAWPQRLNIEYWRDADTDRAHWFVKPDSLRLPPSMMAAANFAAQPAPRFSGSGSLGFQGSAPGAKLAAPEFTVTAANMPLPGATHYEMLLQSPRGAPTVNVVFPATAGVQELTISTSSGAQLANPVELGSGARLFTVTALPAAGIRIAFETHAPGPVDILVFDASYGLPDEISPQVELLQRARPADATSSQDGDLTVVQHTVRLDPAAGR